MVSKTHRKESECLPIALKDVKPSSTMAKAAAVSPNFVDFVQELPKPLCDGVAVRRGNDLFVRAVLSDGIRKDEEVGEFKLAYPVDLPYDQRVKSIIDSEPDLSSLINNSVIIEVWKNGQDVPDNASGAILSPRIIITSGHQFRDGVIREIIVNYGEALSCKAKLIPLPGHLTELFHQHSKIYGNLDLSWTRKYPDIAVLETETPLVLQARPLIVSPDIPFTAGSVVAMSGFAGKQLSANVRTFFTSDFLDWVSEACDMDQVETDEYLTQILNIGFSGFECRVVCFGAMKHAPAFQYPQSFDGMGYCLTTMSSMPGLSGAPVVTTDHPEFLVGLNVGTFKDIPGSCVILAQSPPFIALYEWFVGPSARDPMLFESQ